MIDAIINLQPEYIGIIMIMVMLFAIFVGFPISFTLIFFDSFDSVAKYNTERIAYLLALDNIDLIIYG